MTADPPWHRWLRGGPRDLILWATPHDNPRTAWPRCPRADWLLWALGSSGADRRTLVRATCQCAELVVPHLAADDARSHHLLAVVSAWADRRPQARAVSGLVGGQGGSSEERAARAVVYAAYTSASPDPEVSARSAAAAAAGAASLLGDGQSRVVAMVLDLRWELSVPNLRRWPESAQVAWDLVQERTSARSDLSTVEALCARSALPTLPVDGRRKFAALAERLALVPGLEPKVRALLADMD